MSLKSICIYLLAFFLSYSVLGQTLQIKDFDDETPIEGVAIYNQTKNKSGITDKEGLVKLDKFSDTELIHVQHRSYQEILMSKQQLKKQGYVVYLYKLVVRLEESVISVYRWEQKKEEIPNKITSILQPQISFNDPQTTADLLATSSEVFIQKSQLGGGSPMIRGFSANSVLLVVDGVRMNNAIYRGGNLQNVISLDANSIQRSEVIFGPGSITYGSDALGGVMDFHTLPVRLSTSKQFKLKGTAFARHSSANSEKTGHVDLNLGNDKIGILSSITYSDYGDLTMGSNNNSDYQRNEYVDQINGIDQIIINNKPNKQIQSGYSQINTMHKIRFRPSRKINLDYAFHYSRLSDVPRYDRLIQVRKGALEYGEWYYGPQKWDMHRLNFTYNNKGLLFDKLKVTTAYQDYEESRHDRKFGKKEIRERTEEVKAYSLNFDLDKEFNSNNMLFYGLEAVYNTVNSIGHIKNIITNELSPVSTRYPDGENDYTTLAMYLGYKDNITKSFTIITGLRANYVSIYSTLKDKTFFNFPYNEISVKNKAINGSLGLVYRFRGCQINLNLSSGFHAPNIDDISKIFDSSPKNVVVPNKNLKPEYVYNIDNGIEAQLGNRGTFNFTYFFTFLTDAFVRRDFSFNGQDSIVYDGEMSNVQAVVNANKAHIYGCSSKIKLELFRNLELKSIISFTKGEDQDGIPLRHVSPLFGSTRVTYTYKKIKASVFANYNGEISHKNLAPSEHSKTYMYAIDKDGNPYSPSWFTLSCMVSYKIKKFGILNVGVENILDNRYRPYSSGIVAPGRNLIASLRVSF